MEQSSSNSHWSTIRGIVTCNSSTNSAQGDRVPSVLTKILATQTNSTFIQKDNPGTIVNTEDV